MSENIKPRGKITAEEEKVVLPLEKWFRSRRTKWTNIILPNYGTSATGWDLEVERHNQVLLIEAKYIQGPFLSSFGGLVTAPLAYRRQKTIKKKYRGWCAYHCWAIGSSKDSIGIYQIFFDYIGRNMEFWNSYGKILKMKYVFFINEGRVVRLSWDQVLKAGESYVAKINKIPNHNSIMKLADRRRVAGKIMDRYTD